VVDDEVEQDADSTCLCVCPELGELAVRPEPRVDAVLGDVAAVVAVRRRLGGRKPDDVNAEALEVVEAPAQADKVADPIPVPRP